MYKTLGVISLCLLMCISCTFGDDISEDCDVIQLNRVEIGMRRPLEEFLFSRIALFGANEDELLDTCRMYEEWYEAMDELLPDCEYSTAVRTFTYQRHHQTIEVYSFICDSQNEFRLHKPCLSQPQVLSGLAGCYNTFVDKYIKLLGKDEPMSYIHDKSCDAVEVAIDCAYNFSKTFCDVAAAEYYEDYFRAFVDPSIEIWDCRFDDGWGSIVIVGMLIAVLAIVALVWACAFLTCRYCNLSCCSCCGGSDSADYDPEVHPMERY